MKEFLNKANLLCRSLIVAVMCLPAAVMAAESFDDYKLVKSLGGTSQSICRPGINSDEDLKTFALKQREDLIAILQDSGWKGDPEDMFAAISAGDFIEKSYPVGTRLVWMGMREQGTPVAAEKRQWAGQTPFEGFEINIESNCRHHRLVFPKACCNLSLLQSSPIEIPRPAVSVSREGGVSTISMNSFGGDSIIDLTYPDGRIETLQLGDNRWSGALEPGGYRLVARRVNDCGESVPVTYTFDVPAPAVTPASGLLFNPFIGRQVRSIDPPLVGIQVGWLKPIGEKTGWFVQGGGSYNLSASELSVFLDTGIERRLGDGGAFFGVGLGMWDINNNDNLPNSSSPKTDLSYFIHGGANTPWSYRDRPVQWFVEARIFDDFVDNISHHNILKLGLRYLY